MNNDLHARDLTQLERLDAFGTGRTEALIDICKARGIEHYTRANRLGVVIWRCHLPDDLEAKLKKREDAGVVYVEGWRKSA